MKDYWQTQPPGTLDQLLFHVLLGGLELVLDLITTKTPNTNDKSIYWM